MQGIFDYLVTKHKGKVQMYCPALHFDKS